MLKPEPFKGSRYKERRILILGESSWGTPTDITDADYVKHWLRHPSFRANWHSCDQCHLFGKAVKPGDKP